MSTATTPMAAPAPAKEIGSSPDMWDPSMLFSFAPTTSQFGVSQTPTTDLELARPSALLPYTPAKQLSPDWFMSPESWKIDRDSTHYEDPMPPPSPYSRIALKTFLTTGQKWLSDWISNGGNTFIHKQLYSFQLPRCTQDAYTAVALYLLRTDENEDMVHRTIQSRSAQLMEDEEKHKTSSSLNPFNHLARVQALLVYQIICLLDGDIRLRALAEERIPTMMAWLKQMLDSVSFASQLTPSGPTGTMTAARGLGLGIVEIMDAVSSTPGASPSPPTPATAATARDPGSQQEEVLWHAWIFSESVRRTWIFAQGLHTVYDVMLKSWTMCPGALKLTTVSDVWDASSSYAWSKICVEKDVRLSTPSEVENFLTEARPENVDDFTTSLLEVMFGKAKMERWRDTKT